MESSFGRESMEATVRKEWRGERGGGWPVWEYDATGINQGRGCCGSGFWW